MVKPPRIRHSKPRREPVTIDLDPGEVMRSAAVAEEAPPAAAGPEASQAARYHEAVAEAREKSLLDEPGPAGEGPEAKAAEAAASGPAPAEPSGPPASPAPVFGRDDGASGAAGTGRPGRTPEPQPQPQPRRSFASLMTAGLAGGVVALLGYGVLQFAGIVPGAGAPPAVDLAGVRDEIAALRGELAALQGQAPDTAAIVEARSRLDAVAGEVGALRTELGEVKASLEAGGAGEAPALASLQAELDRLSASLGELREAGASGAGTEALAARIGEVETLARGASDAAAAAAASATAAAGAAGAASERIAAVEAEIARLSERLDQAAENPRIALAIAAAGLKSAIDRGMPFMTELETYAAIAPDAPEIAALRELAATGVPTRAEIAARAPAALTRMVEAARPVDPDAGFIERLLASLESVIKVRPIGEVEGEGVGPTAARIEAAIAANDYRRAIAEYETLPEVAKAAGAELIAAVRARMSADELVEKALSVALGA